MNMVNLVIQGPLADPHSILGMHLEDGALAVRAYCPGAVSMELIRHGGSFEMKKLDERGFFIWTAARGETSFFPYELRITYADRSSWQTPDPYSFPPQLGSSTSIFSDRESTLNSTEKWGAGCGGSEMSPEPSSPYGLPPPGRLAWWVPSTAGTGADTP